MAIRPLLRMKLLCECPHCGAHLDLFEEDDCPETADLREPPNASTLVQAWLNNAPHRPMRVECGRCEGPFDIDGLEW